MDGQAPTSVCANCTAPLVGPYCAQCGQKAAHRILSLRHILEDALEDQLSLNAALPRTLRVLFLHPGRLTREYVAGRVASYIPPMRLYLMASVLFFLVMAALPDAASEVKVTETPSEPARATGHPTGAVAPAAPGVSSVNITGPGVSMRLDTLGTPRWMHPAILRLIAQNQRLHGMKPQEAKRALVAGLANDLPKVVFVLLPVFALLLKLLYIRRRRLYVEHFVFALHLHALVFLAFTVQLLVGSSVLRVLLYLGVAVYLWQALRVVYGQGWARTTLKFGLLSLSYLTLAALGLGLAVVAALFAI